MSAVKTVYEYTAVLSAPLHLYLHLYPLTLGLLYLSRLAPPGSGDAVKQLPLDRPVPGRLFP